ncbi:hypothetical protein RHMOL_Rhmol06G0298200 [Rhododendron molle]|uniref:Uncharacterized protein n=1 Tax=Rhododendron molle TaxID=49168 RepID=A0ACC0NJP0_RHOML|nr:hypothetical protein RHMOL_Rhmol06G0298200 [Rhododendron molle]
MDELSPHCPSGTVSFCQTFAKCGGRHSHDSLKLENHAKFRSSLMETYASLTMSIATEALMGWHVRDELETLESYNVAANVHSSSLMKVCIGSSSLMI